MYWSVWLVIKAIIKIKSYTVCKMGCCLGRAIPSDTKLVELKLAPHGVNERKINRWRQWFKLIFFRLIACIISSKSAVEPMGGGFRVARDTIPSNFHENQISQVGSVFLPIIYIKGQIPSFVFINRTHETLINSKRKKANFLFHTEIG